VNRQITDRRKEAWREQLLYYTMIAMMLSLFLSRAALSISMIAFVVFSFLHSDTRNHFRNFISSPLLWATSLLFFLPLVSGLWSENKEEWLEIVQLKLPLLFFPLAFASPFQFSKQKWKWLGYVFIVLVVCASIWSMFHYVSNISEVHEGYLRAKSILTPLKNDHVRFSWLVSVAILLAASLWITVDSKTRIASWCLPIAIIWLIIFLHILAARTGLFSFYLVLIVTVLWLAFKKAKPLKALLIVLGLVALPMIAYLTLPTFHNRVSYILYDMSYFREAAYLPGANDAVRVISLKAGWELMMEFPASGTGFGDIDIETRKWYSENFPQMLETDMIRPSSEWLIHGAGMGWPGFLAFSVVMLIPFFVPVQDKLPWWLLNLTVAFSFLFDIGLEVQFGVFIYAFIVLWWWKWLKA
jgi:O-antigen ligase